MVLQILKETLDKKKVCWWYLHSLSHNGHSLLFILSPPKMKHLLASFLRHKEPREVTTNAFTRGRRLNTNSHWVHSFRLPTWCLTPKGDVQKGPLPWIDRIAGDFCALLWRKIFSCVLASSTVQSTSLVLSLPRMSSLYWHWSFHLSFGAFFFFSFPSTKTSQKNK